MINNPIIPGFYPDPSIIRVEGDFYLVTSSFSYFPGIPIFHSKDLRKWEQIGHVLDRKDQLQVTYEMISSGIFAPTIRYHEGIFYVITTNASMQGANFIVTAADPRGPWSEPYVIEGAVGIDPSLFFDQDGKVYYTGTSGYGEEPGIWCSELDLATMSLVGERKVLWQGALRNASSPEGPHLYKKDDWYYLMISEGGTEHFHAITISRSKDILGPYEGYRGNPILTHRQLGKDYPICNVGHGDLVELADGSWWLVCLASRLIDDYHKPLGRETFIAPVIWEDGWPVVSPGTGRIEESYENPTNLTAATSMTNTSFYDDFQSHQLNWQWNFLGTPYEDFCTLKDGKLYLRLLKKQLTPWELDGLSTNLYEKYQVIGKTKECVSFVGKRRQDSHFESSTQFECNLEEDETAGMVLLQNNAHQLRFEVSRINDDEVQVSVLKTVMLIENKRQIFNETALTSKVLPCRSNGIVYLTIECRGSSFDFYAGSQKKQLFPVAEHVSGKHLGSESAGGFVGTYIGLYASGVTATKEKSVAFEYFAYRPIEKENERS